MNWVADYLTRHPSKADKVVHRAERSIHFRNPDGSLEGVFTLRPIHYRDGDVWREIDTALVPDGQGRYGAPGLKTRMLPDGPTTLEGSSYSSWTKRIGVLDTARRRFTSRLTLPAGTVQGDSIVAQGAGFRHTRTLTEIGYQELLELTDASLVAGAAGADLLVMETVLTGISLPDGWVTEMALAELNFPLPSGVDAAGNPAPVVRYARTSGGVQYLYTGIQVSWLQTASYPVAIDPDYTTLATLDWVDGRHATSSALARTTYYANSSTDTNIYVGFRYSGGNYLVYRGVLSFDTTAIPVDATINSATLDLTVSGNTSSVEFDLSIRKYNWYVSGWTGANVFSGMLLAAAEGTLFNTTGIATNTHYQRSIADLTHICSQTGTYARWTSFGLINLTDYNGGTQTGTTSEYITFASGGHATTAYRPFLTVNYSQGEVSTNGTLSATFAAMTLAGTGEVPIEGVANNLAMSAMTLAGSGEVPIEGVANNLAMGAMTLTGAGEVPIEGAATLAFGAMGLVATGTVEGTTEPSTSGQLVVTFDAMTMSGAGAVPVEGAANNLAMGAMTLTGSGEVPIGGQLSASFAAMGLTATGDVPIDGQLALALGAMTLSGAAELPLAGALAITLDGMTLVGTGEVPIAGSLTGDFDAMTLSGTGVVFVLGDPSPEGFMLVPDPRRSWRVPDPVRKLMVDDPERVWPLRPAYRLRVVPDPHRMKEVSHAD